MKPLPPVTSVRRNEPPAGREEAPDPLGPALWERMARAIEQDDRWALAAQPPN
jgi:hypothetical protein